MERRVGIIGAGTSGLLACKYVVDNGFHPVVFEAKSDIGGVWTQTMETTKLQNPKQAYQFSDFPWPSSVREDFPDHNQVLDYIKSYASHFNLPRYIKFNSNVLSIDYEGASNEEMLSWDLWGGTGDPFNPNRKWTVTVQDTQLQIMKIYQVEFLILCIGKVSGLPNIPEFPPTKGPEIFDGEVIHSMDYSAMDGASAAKLIKGKRVAIIGIQKSAIDLAVECATVNGVECPCTVIYRSPHWSFPEFSAWGVPLPFLYFNRFAEFMIHKPREGFMLCLLATILSPLRWLTSKFVESYIRWKLPLKKYNMVPNHSFNQEFSACKISSAGNFYKKVEEGSIFLKKTSSLSFCKDSLIIDSTIKPLKTDIVIFATGFKGDQKLKNIFVSPLFQKYVMGSESTIKAPLPLYRECLHPHIPQLAMIGYSENLLFLHTSEMRCRWLAYLLKEKFRVPRIKRMEEDVQEWEKIMQKYGGEYNLRSKCMSALFIWYNDQLCRDMGCNPRRKKGFFAEVFEPYGAMDYASLFP